LGIKERAAKEIEQKKERAQKIVGVSM